jgi:class 3 adenylate cyclase/tetratricopeptide (TPR) repeat protein
MASTALTCPQCGFENPPQMRFCGNCGAALAISKGTEERKLVTILFADVVGSTKLSSRIDPERMHDMMTRFFGIARKEIERFGGTVEKFIGDAVVAVFGLPAVHEDDPERAVRAAVAIRSRMRLEVQTGTLPEIRMGINTGEVVANPQAHEKGEFLVTGEMVNLAARFQQHAEAGQILVGERTMHAIFQIASLVPIPALTVRGAATPVAAWALIDVQPPRGRELRATPFIGREEELSLLQGHLRRMLREGRGHVATILGPAGVGKTRLAREYRLRAGVHSLNGRAVPYGTGVPFWALGEALREECGILFGDPLEDARQKVYDTAARLETAEAVPALNSVLGMAGDGIDLTRDALFAGMRTFFQALARRSPLLLILEDIHLAEDVTLDFLEHAADWVRSVPLLLLGLARPDLLEHRTAWMGGKQSATTIVLDPFGNEESLELVGAILKGKPAPDPLITMVTEPADGNPLFMEEILRSLIDRGVLVEMAGAWQLTMPLAEVMIPDTVHAVVAARVDALPAREKSVLQNAALQGKDFWRGGLQAVADQNHIEETVRRLVAKELIVPKRRSTIAGEEEFTFRHILIRDIAYGSIPKAQRWPKHERVAKWIEQIAGDRRAEFADIIAHHWLQVIGLQQELGLAPAAAARERAVSSLLLAGQRAAAVYANTTALDHFTRVIDLDPPTEARQTALEGRGEVWMLLGKYDQAREDFVAIQSLAHDRKEPRWEALALDGLGRAFRQQDQIRQALTHLEEALALSRSVGDPVLTADILNHIGFTYFADGKHREALKAHEEARQLLSSVQALPSLAESLHGLGENLVFLGQWREAIARLSESAMISERIGNRSLAGENRLMIALSREMLADYEAAVDESRRAVAILSEIGDVRDLSAALGVSAAIAVRLGEFDQALESASRGLALATQMEAIRLMTYSLLWQGVVYRELQDYRSASQVDREAADRASGVGGAWLPWVLCSLALDAVELGRLDEAKTFLTSARRAIEQSQTRVTFLEELTRAEARLALASGTPDRALEAAHTLLELLKKSDSQYYRIPALLLKAEAEMALGNLNSAAEVYAAVVEHAETSKRLPDLWRALAGLAETLVLLGRRDDASSAARRAREVVERLAKAVADERLRATFLQSVRVQRVTSLIGS